MMHIKRVRFEELERYLRGTQRIAVEVDGKVVGHYDPRDRSPSASLTKSLDAITTRTASDDGTNYLEKMYQEIYERTGMTEEDMAEFLDPSLGCICDGCTRDDDP
jgi:hypothetical protein